jgi:hypothetical protein
MRLNFDVFSCVINFYIPALSRAFEVLIFGVSLNLVRNVAVRCHFFGFCFESRLKRPQFSYNKSGSSQQLAAEEETFHSLLIQSNRVHQHILQLLQLNKAFKCDGDEQSPRVVNTKCINILNKINIT